MPGRRQRIRKGLLLLFLVLFPVVLNFLSPYLSIAGASRGIIGGSLLLFAALFFSSLFLGRAFCSWVCPGGAAQEVCFPINGRTVNRKALDWIKWAIWLPWFGTILFLFIRAGGKIRVEPLYMTESWISVDSPSKYLIYYFVLALILVIAIAAGRRAMCHSACWMAPFMIVGRKIRNLLPWPSLKLEASVERCTACRGCTKNCPMSLPVHELVQRPNMESAECILCGQCVDNCPRSVIRYSFKTGR